VICKTAIAKTFLITLGLLLAARSARGANTSYTFNQSGTGTYAWSTSSNWVGNLIPTSGTATSVLFLSNTTTAWGNGTITVNSDPATLTLNTLALNGQGPASGSSTVNIGTSGGTWTFDGASPAVYVNSAVNSGNVASFNVNPNITLDQNLAITCNSAAPLTLSGNIIDGSSGSAITVSGTGRVTLSGSNTFNAGLIVQSGTLAIPSWNTPGTSGPLGLANSGTTTATRFQIGASGQSATVEYTGASGGTAATIFNFSGTAAFQIDNPGANVVLNGSTELNGNATVIKTGPGEVTLVNGNKGAFTGNVIVSSGVLALQNYSAIDSATLTLNGGTLDLNNPTGFPNSNKKIFGNNTVISANSSIISEPSSPGSGSTYYLANLSIGSCILSVSGGVTNAGTAGLSFTNTTLTGAATFNINNPVSGGTTLLTLGPLNNAGFTATLTGNGNFAQPTGGAISGTGGFTLSAGYSGVATFSQTNNYTGATTIIGGSLIANAVNTLSPSSAVSLGGGLLDVTAGSESVPRFSMTGGTLNLNFGTLFSISSTTAAFGGTLNLTNLSGSSLGANSYELIAYPNATASGSFHFASSASFAGYQLENINHQLDLVKATAWNVSHSGSWNTGSNWSSNSVPSGAGVSVLLANATTSRTTISLDSPQTLGTLAFTNTAGYALTTGTSGNGSLRLNNTGGTIGGQIIVSAGSNSIAAPLIISNSAAYVSISGSGSLDLSRAISGSHSLSLSSPDATGVLSLDGTNTFSGGVYVNSGMLILNGAPSLSPGSGLTIGTTNPPSVPTVLLSPVNGAALNLAPVPEPGTLSLFMFAALGSAVACYRFLRRPG
jgi:autotransporter-associated beta strand protein